MTGSVPPLARHLAEDAPEADQARQTVKALVAGESPKTGGILVALRPFVGDFLHCIVDSEARPSTVSRYEFDACFFECGLYTFDRPAPQLFTPFEAGHRLG
jgi:hypothetical protein